VQKNSYQYLSAFSGDAHLVDSLITSAFIRLNGLQTANLLLQNYLIGDDSPHHDTLTGFLGTIAAQFGTDILNFEHLIELFEFVVSPAEKVVNGAVYTPAYIREYIVQRTLEGADIGEDYRLADIACGCGGFLLTAAQQLHERTGLSYADIYRRHLYGVDIMSYSIARTRILLSLWAVCAGEEEPVFDFQLFEGNSLIFDWGLATGEQPFAGFDVVVGNPPYVASRNMTAETLASLERWSVAGTGHPDLYIPFFQIGFELLKPRGILGLITVNTFIKSINGRALRQYFADEQADLVIINFGGEQVFRDRNTYTCLCFLRRQAAEGVAYIRCDSQLIGELADEDLLRFDYAELDHPGGWNLVNTLEIQAFVNQVEGTGRPFKQLYVTKNGIATLKNDIYKFTPTGEDADYYYFQNRGGEHQVEKRICRDIVNANKLRTPGDLADRREKIIFPYTVASGMVSILPEPVFRADYPQAYAYLSAFRAELATRDKGRKTYEAWYAYGRRQSMDVRGHKLFFPHICERPNFVICQEPEMLFYNGIAIVSENMRELLVIKKVLESALFFKYISNSTKDYASGYISMSRNYLKNFGVYQFTEEEKTQLLETEDTEAFLEQCYGIVINI